MLRILVISCSAISMVSCAALEEMRLRNEEAYRTRYCSYEGAFALGVNQAKANLEMDPDVARLCSTEIKAEVQKGYREGYVSGSQNRPVTIQLAPVKQECHSSFGEKVCGYNCIQSYGHWHCGSNPSHVCVESFGKVKCGVNCRTHYGDIKCDAG